MCFQDFDRDGPNFAILDLLGAEMSPPIKGGRGRLKEEERSRIEKELVQQKTCINHHKVMTYWCLDHKAACCPACIIMDHRHHDIIKVDELKCEDSQYGG